MDEWLRERQGLFAPFLLLGLRLATMYLLLFAIIGLPAGKVRMLQCNYEKSLKDDDEDGDTASFDKYDNVMKIPEMKTNHENSSFFLALCIQFFNKKDWVDDDWRGVYGQLWNYDKHIYKHINI